MQPELAPQPEPVETIEEPEEVEETEDISFNKKVEIKDGNIPAFLRKLKK